MQLWPVVWSFGARQVGKASIIWLEKFLTRVNDFQSTDGRGATDNGFPVKLGKDAVLRFFSYLWHRAGLSLRWPRSLAPTVP
jgi:hypothetical protein